MTLAAIVQELGSDANAAASGFAIRTLSARIIQTLEASGQFENTLADDLFAALAFASGCVLHGLGGSRDWRVKGVDVGAKFIANGAGLDE